MLSYYTRMYAGVEVVEVCCSVNRLRLYIKDASSERLRGGKGGGRLVVFEPYIYFIYIRHSYGKTTCTEMAVYRSVKGSEGER